MSTLARPRVRVGRGTAEVAALAVLLGAGLALWASYDVYPTFDSMWHLAWGREILDGTLPSFDAHRAPTEHPLLVAVSTLLVPLGEHAAPRALTLIGVLSWVTVLAGVYRLGRATFGTAAAVLAVALLATRLNFPFWAAFAFVDIPYLALLVWAAALEAERPRRGGVVWVLLVAAGLLRPEAWLFAGAYALRLGRRARNAVWFALPIVLWAVVDLVVTGDPTYSFTMSTDHAAELGRDRSLLDLPRATLNSAEELVKWPVVVLGAAGLALGWRRHRYPVALLVIGTVGFLIVSATGFSVIPRYFAFPAVVLTLFAGYALTGWIGRADRRWMAAAALVAVVGGAWQVTRLHPGSVRSDMRYRAAVVADLEDVLASPAMACGPVSLPNHLLQPFAIWFTGNDVVARTDRTPPTGTALLTLTSRLNEHPSFGVLNRRIRDPALTLVPPPGYERAAFTSLFSVYTRC